MLPNGAGVSVTNLRMVGEVRHAHGRGAAGVYIEKEGFSEALKAVRWGERHDCDGFTSTAGRLDRAAAGAKNYQELTADVRNR
jgi:hypothetical protein